MCSVFMYLLHFKLLESSFSPFANLELFPLLKCRLLRLLSRPVVLCLLSSISFVHLLNISGFLLFISFLTCQSLSYVQIFYMPSSLFMLLTYFGSFTIFLFYYGFLSLPHSNFFNLLLSTFQILQILKICYIMVLNIYFHFFIL